MSSKLQKSKKTLRRVKTYTELSKTDMEFDIDETDDDFNDDFCVGNNLSNRNQDFTKNTTTSSTNSLPNAITSSGFSQRPFGSLLDSFPPKTSNDLAVHNKKIDEVSRWINKQINVPKGAKTLLLTGPCGSGKTATVKTVCSEMDINVLEYEPNREFELSYISDEVWDKSEIKIFQRFIHDAEYSSVERSSKRRIILVEHLPNKFYREPQIFHDFLRDFSTCSRSIFIIVMSNMGNRWELSPDRILPESITRELSIEHIRFNSIAKTFMQKALRRIVLNLNLNVSERFISELATSADGDVRSAINRLEFSIMHNQLNPALITSAISINLFHFIGKILYSKRVEPVSNKWNICEERLQKNIFEKWSRPFPPKDNVHELLVASDISGSKLAEFVFEHEPNFTNSLFTISKVFSDLCEFDSTLKNIELQTNTLFDSYLLQIVARSTIFYNYNANPIKKTLYKFEKPKLRSVKSMLLETKLKSVEIFSNIRCREICFLTLPMLSLIKRPLNIAQLELIQSLAINKERFRRFAQKRNIFTKTDAPNWRCFNISENSAPPALDDGFNYDIEEDDNTDDN